MSCLRRLRPSEEQSSIYDVFFLDQCNQNRSLTTAMNLLSLFFLSALLTLSSSLQPSDNELHKYIIQVRNDQKPLVFSDAEYWYQSMLSSVASDLQDVQNSKENNLLIHTYKTALHGFAAELTTQQAEMIQSREEVVGVFPDRMLQLHTTRTPEFLGLIGNGKASYSSGLLNVSNYGSDVVIGVMDTGVWPEHQSFNDYGLEPIPARWKGQCVQGQKFTKNNCNKKLIGARFFANGFSPKQIQGYNSARDSDGHGTHTSSTAAGSRVSNASLFGNAHGTASGVAPKARIAVYKVCWPSGCTVIDAIAAYDKAMEDGVDIISFSIGGGAHPYHEDPLAIAQFAAMERNILVSASAGNSGPYVGTLSNIPPWVTTVGAGTIDRGFPADIAFADGHIFTGVGINSITSFAATTFSSLVIADGTDFSCIPALLDPKAVRGKIVMCERGDAPRTVQGEIVKKAGGVGMVLANTDAEGEDLVIDAHVLPTVAITRSVAQKLRNYLNSAKSPRAKIVFRGTELNVKPAPTVAGFSSRGPNTESIHITKPDLIGPGVDILAAWPDGVGPTGYRSDERRTKFNMLSGTSMSCPHISGVAALIKATHPDWSPSRIKSAMMTTSYVVDNTGSHLLDASTYTASTPWDHGSGHVDPVKALDPGLVYDLTADDYIDFLCASGYSIREIGIITMRRVNCKKGLQPWNLNYPSISVSFVRSRAQRDEVSVTRTVTQVSESASTYTVRVENPKGVSVTVDPPRLVFKRKNEKLSYVVKLLVLKTDPSPDLISRSLFGRLTWQDGKHQVGMPIAVTFTNN